MILLLALLTLFSVSPLNADILRVPEEYETIRDALNMVIEGDTVLVAPGSYNGFSHRDITFTIASKYMITKDVYYIDSTIIRTPIGLNGWQRPYLDFRIIGFTITEGLYCHARNASIENCTFKNCDERALSLEHGVNIIKDCLFVDNNSRYRTLHIGSADTLAIINSSFISNTVGRNTLIWNNRTPMSLINCTIYDNAVADDPGRAIYLSNANLSLVNTIVWDHEFPAVWCDTANAGSDISINYCDIEDGEDGIELNDSGDLSWGDGNIDEDPLLLMVDSGEYIPDEDSPCIDAGDPDSPNDPDGTRADMGSSNSFITVPVHGSVINAANADPIEGVEFYIHEHLRTRSDSLGNLQFRVSPNLNFDVTAAKSGFNDSTLANLEAHYGDTLQLDFGLLHPDFEPDLRSVDDWLHEGDSIVIELNIDNLGNGPLEWSVEKRLRDETEFSNHYIKESIEISDIVEDERLEGVCFIEGNYYLTGRNRSRADDNPNMIYIVNREYELVDYFTQPDANDNNGMADISYDSEEQIIWGAVNSRVYGISQEGDILANWQLHRDIYRLHSVAWDCDRDLIWVSTIVSDIFGCTPDGEIVDTIPRGNFRNYGLAYWMEDPDGYPLYVLSQTNNRPLQLLKIDPGTDEILFLNDYEVDESIDPAGIFITDQYNRYSTDLVQLAENGGRDKIYISHLQCNTSWFELDIYSGVIQSEEFQEINVSFIARDIAPDLYQGRLHFFHNAAGGEQWLPVSMDVVNDVQSDPSSLTPSSLSLSAFPNPFNSSTRLTYSVPQPGLVHLKLFDIAGREIKLLNTSFHPAGVYNYNLNASDLATGLYLVRIEAAGLHKTKKIAIIN